jgi:TatD DNase family protein
MSEWFDAHCHWQDAALGGPQAPLWAELATAEISGGVVNGTCPADWAAVAELVSHVAGTRAAYGVHPWWVDDLSVDWEEELSQRWRAGGLVGEIGLDRWKTTANFGWQEEVFVWQWRWAVQNNVPATVHCLRAWPDLKKLIQRESAPAVGFLLHAYGGPPEEIDFWTECGASFSFSTGFLGPMKTAKARAFLRVPLDRVLVETDAPSMAPPPNLAIAELPPKVDGERLNHPLNLLAAGRSLAELFGLTNDEMAALTTANARRLFGCGELG